MSADNILYMATTSHVRSLWLCRHRRCRSTLRSLSPQLSAPPLTLAAPPPIVAVAAIAGAVITDAVAATVTVRLASCTCTCRRRCAARAGEAHSAPRSGALW